MRLRLRGAAGLLQGGLAPLLPAQLRADPSQITGPPLGEGR